MTDLRFDFAFYHPPLLGQARMKNKNLASIHIGTLAQYTGHGPGDYALTAIKQMTGSENFLAWPEDKRKCALEEYEKCQMKGFLGASMKCGCSPFQLLPAKGNIDQVLILKYIDSVQTLNQICLPAEMECYRKRKSSSCGVACQGLYADVTKRQKSHNIFQI